jgi:hypothetical protein
MHMSRRQMAMAMACLVVPVGTTGNAAPDAPHLHLAVFQPGPEKQWWKGEALNPCSAWRATRSGSASR